MIPQNNIQKRSFYREGFLINWRISKYSLLSIIYFFFNSVLLPKGLLFTHILSPVFYVNLIRNKRKTYLLPFASFLTVYDCIHLYQGVDYKSFFISNILFVCTYFCVISFFHFVNKYEKLSKIFKQVALVNAALAIIAVPFFFAPKQYQQWFWYINKLTEGVEEFPRLALSTYEASYYSLLLIPVWFYYLLKFIFNKFETGKWSTLLLVTMPMLMSLSFGVLGATFLTAVIMCVVFCRQLFKYKRPFIIISVLSASLLVGTILLFIFFPQNAFFVRIENILAGNDTSTNGRTTESFIMAWRIADLKSIFFGAGLGQIKIMATEVVHKYFKYWGDFVRYDIPNAMGETLAIFGLIGVIVRLALEIFLFTRTRVFDNYYRLALFIFIFIYQFTGSFITNIVEYMIWILAFSNVFLQFDRIKKEV